MCYKSQKTFDRGVDVFFLFFVIFTHIQKKTSALCGLLDEAPKASGRISWLRSRVNGFFTAALPKGKGKNHLERSAEEKKMKTHSDIPLEKLRNGEKGFFPFCHRLPPSVK